MSNHPTCWDASRSGSHVNVDGCTAKYVGAGASDRDAASVRADAPSLRSEPLFYFEVRVRSAGREGFIGVGLSASGVRADRLPGWEPGSVGYHGDDGRLFVGGARGSAYGPTYTTGDVVGCLLDRANRTVEFFKNGVALGIAVRGFGGEDLWPTVGMRTPGEEVEGIFSPPYVADESRMKAEAVRAAKDRVQRACKEDERMKHAAMEAVQAHLRHHGYIRSARMLAYAHTHRREDEVMAEEVLGSDETKNMEEDGESSPYGSDSQLTLAVDMARTGDVSGCMAILEEIRGEDAEPLPARLRLLAACQSLIEAVRQGNTPAALNVARGELARAARDGGDARGEDAETMREAVALLAYEDPAASPVGHCLAQAQRERFADAVRAFAWSTLHDGEKSGEACVEESPLETLTKQTIVVLQELQDMGCATASLLDICDYVPFK